MIIFFHQLRLYQLSYDNSCSIAYFQCFASGSHNFRIGNDVFTARDAIGKTIVGNNVSLCVPPYSSYNLSLFSRRSVQLDNKHIAFGQARHLSRDETDFLGANEGVGPNHVFLVFWSDFQLPRFVCEGLSARKPMLIYLLGVVFVIFAVMTVIHPWLLILAGGWRYGCHPCCGCSAHGSGPQYYGKERTVMTISTAMCAFFGQGPWWTATSDLHHRGLWRGWTDLYTCAAFSSHSHDMMFQDNMGGCTM